MQEVSQICQRDITMPIGCIVKKHTLWRSLRGLLYAPVVAVSISPSPMAIVLFQTNKSKYPFSHLVYATHLPLLIPEGCSYLMEQHKHMTRQHIKV